jgi:hypothetical protein
MHDASFRPMRALGVFKAPLVAVYSAVRKIDPLRPEA